MQTKVTIAFVWIVTGIVSIRVAAACSCPPPPPPPIGTQPAVRVPSLRDKGSAVFLGVVEDVYPRALADYEVRWRQIYREDLSADKPPSVARMGSFVLRFWPKLFSPSERERIKAARSINDLESAVGRFWLTPRRVLLRIEEPFAGPQAGRFMLYTGIGGGDCGIDFKVDDHWLVDAHLDDAGRWIAHLCSVTVPASEAIAVVNTLRAERRFQGHVASQPDERP